MDDNKGALTRSQLASQMIHLDGRNFSLDNYKPFEAVYDGVWDQVLLKAGRQVGKSTSLANFILIGSVILDYFRTLYVSPKQQQTRMFSNSRVGKTIESSPMIKQNFFSHTLTNQVFHRCLTNGAEMYFAYADDNADRIRGLSSDLCCFDEIQDMVYDEVVPIVQETMSASPYAYSMFAGTPKTVENSIEHIWSSWSSQTMWVMKCESCNTWNEPTEEIIGKESIVCRKCGSRLSARNGQWADQVKNYNVKGFHLPQIIFPFHTESPKKWRDILRKRNDMKPAQFKNEVMGESCSTGVRLITRGELEDFCNPDVSIRSKPREERKNYGYVVAGVDWGGGGKTHNSMTAITILGYAGDNLQVADYRIISSGNPMNEVKDVIALCKEWDVHCVVADAGGGRMANSVIAESLGPNKVYQCQYCSQREVLKFYTGNEYKGDKCLLLDELFMNLKDGRFRFPRAEECTEYFSHILAEYEELNDMTGKKRWTKPPGVPDDCLHSLLYADLAMRVVIQNFDFKVRYTV